MEIIMLLVILLLVVWIIYEGIMYIYRKTLRYETLFANLPVCKKEYKEEQITYIKAGKIMVPQINEEEHIIYVMYEDKLYCIDSKELYQKINIGDTVCVKVHKGYNKKKEVKNIFISV